MQPADRCRTQYPRPVNVAPNTRIVECVLPSHHLNDHEDETGARWVNMLGTYDGTQSPAESPTAPQGHRGTGSGGIGAHEDAQGTDGASDVYLVAARALGYRDEHAEDRTRYTAGTASFRAAIDAACLHERGRIADELLAWANADGTALSRRIKSAAFRIAPELTDDEMRAAIGNLLEGMGRRGDH